MSRVEEVLSFWFGELDPQGMASSETTQRWWKKDEAFDREICSRFAADYRRAVAGELDPWLEQPRSRLAYVLVLDQFARNLFRGQARAFEADPLALAAAKGAIDRKMDHALRFAERGFFYLPLMHSERLVDQHLCVRMFELLADENTGARRESAEGSREFAVRHLEIIERFGRFPHRNQALGRKSTPEETEFLTQPGSSF